MSKLLQLKMAFLKVSRETLLFAYSEEWLDDVEFLVLNELNTPKKPLNFPMICTTSLISTISTKLSVLPNRFEKRQISSEHN